MIPEGWEKTHSSYMGTEIRHFTAPVDDSRDAYLENISVTTEVLEEKKMLEDYVKANLDSLQMFYTDFSLSSDTEYITVGGLDAAKISYTYSMGTFALKSSQIFILEDGKAYNILAISEEKNYEKYEDIFTKAFESFKLP